MKIELYTKASFAVIGKEGSTMEGDGFVQRLWAAANSHFDEISHLAKRDERGNPVGFWGAMSDLSRSFRPWEDNFSRGLYLAGVECDESAVAPEGWTKWIVPGYEYLRAECDGGNTFAEVLGYMNDNGFELAGAVHDFTCPITGTNYMYFPIRCI